MRALVTGASGFIGSHVVDTLVRGGHEVRGLDLREAPVGREAAHVVGDVRETGALDDALRDGVDVVFHEAAVVGAGVGPEDAEAYSSVNVLGTIRLLHAMKGSGARLVLASTMAIYGEGAYACDACGGPREGARRPEDLARGRWEPRCPVCTAALHATPTDERHPLRPATLYAISKLDQELTALALGRLVDVPVVALRYHNVYGPRIPRDTPYAGVASLFKSRLLAGEPPLVHEDGAQLRDFVHVTDVARANVLAAEAPVERVAFESFNVGSGEPRPIFDLARTLADELAPHLAPRLSGRHRPGDARHVFGSIEKARRILGYRPSVSFEAGARAFAHDPTTPTTPPESTRR